MLPIGHVGPVAGASFSADGKHVLTYSADKEAKVWDAISGRRVIDIRGHSVQLTAASYSPNGKYIATASADNTVKIWNAKNGQLVSDLPAHSNYVYQATFSPDGQYLLTCASRSSLAKVWNTTTGKLAFGLNHAELTGPSYQIYQASFSPNGAYIVTASESGTAKIWNAKTGKLVITIGDNNSRNVNAVFSPICAIDAIGGKYILTHGGNIAKLWNTTNGQLVLQLEGHNDYITSTSFSPDGQRILTSSADSTAMVWDALTGKPITRLKGHSGAVTNAAFSPDGKYIATASEDGSSCLWNAQHGSLQFVLKGHALTVSSVSYSNDGKQVLTASDDGTARVWDPANGRLITTLEGHTQEIKLAAFSPDGQYMVTTTEDGNAKTWDLHSGQIIRSTNMHSGDIKQVSFSGDSKKMVTCSYDSVAKLWEAGSGQLIAILNGHNGDITAASFSPNGRFIITASTDATVKIWDGANGSLLNNLNVLAYRQVPVSAASSGDSIIYVPPTAESKRMKWAFVPSEVTAAAFSPASSSDPGGGKYILTCGVDFAYIWDANTLQCIRSFKGELGNITRAWFSPDGKAIITSAINFDSLKIWDLNSSEEIHSNLQSFKRFNAFVSFAPNGQYAVITSEYGNTASIIDCKNWKPNREISIKENKISGIDFAAGRLAGIYNSEVNIYDLENGKKQYAAVALDSANYINLLPSGYYHSTPNAAKLLHYVTKDLKIISFEQLDVKYNRPDLVLQAIGNTDTATLRTYRNAYLKRIKKLGIDTTSFRDGYSVPEADFVNRDNISAEQKERTISLHIQGKDDTYPLDRYNVWVNDVPVYGQRGISIRKNNSNSFDKTVDITLSEGENRIETSVINVNGTESYRMPLVVQYNASVTPKETTYFIGIGIDKFANASKNLQYSSKDIHDLSAAMHKQFGNNVVIDTLFNENVTKENIIALKQKLLQTTVNDKVIISYSGHGMLSKSFDYYLSTYAVNFDNPEENGLPYDELENLLDSIPARKKLLLIDACHSGEVDKSDLVVINAVADSMHLTKGTTIVGSKEGKGLGLKNSFELMQNLFVNVGKSTGATVISAAAGTQFALEKNDLQNGVFTYCVLQAMQQYPTIKVSSLRNTVTTNVQKLTNGLQKPTSRNETINVDWQVW
jgi:WD40 repeat protein